MNKFMMWYRSLDETNHFSFYLAVFRVFIGIHLIKKILFKWSGLSLFFSGDFFQLDPSNSLIGVMAPGFLTLVYSNYEWLMFSVLTLALMMIFGIGRRLTIALLFVTICIYQHALFLSLNGGDNLLYFAVLYLCFAQSFDYLCLFRTEQSSPKTKSKWYQLSLTASNLAVYSMMFHLCLVYITSAIHKIHSDVWFNGVALYYILSIDRFSGPLSEIIAKNGFLVTTGTYFTLLFEGLFPILIWYRAHRPWLLMSGIFLHLGIYVTMMIFDFELFFIAVYGFFITNEEWLTVRAWVRDKMLPHSSRSTTALAS